MSRLTPPLPLRPAVPLSLFLFGGLWAGTALVLQRWIALRCALPLFSPFEKSPFLIAGGVLAVVAFIMLCVSRSSVRIVIALIACGLCCGGLLAHTTSNAQNQLIAAFGQYEGRVKVRAVDDAALTPFGTVQSLQILDGVAAGACIQAEYESSVTPLECGQQGGIVDTILPVARSASSKILLSRSLIGRCRVTQIEDRRYWGVLGALSRFRAQATAQIERSASHGAITRAILLGDRRALTPELKEAFARTGLSHVLAVSGSHFAVLVACLYWIGAKVGLDRRVRSLSIIGICLVYVVLTGLPASALRALGMLVVASTSSWLLRRGSPLNALALTGMVCLVVKPFWSISLGFCLSVCAVGGIALFARYGSWLVGALFEAIPRRFSADGALALTALIATMPLTSLTFGYLSVVAPLANVIVAPLMMATLTVALVGLTVLPFSPAIARVFFQGCALGNRVTEWAVCRLSALPWATVATNGGSWLTGSIVAGALLLWWFWPCPKRETLARLGRILVLGLVLVIGLGGVASVLIPDNTGSRVVVLDVGQGDATALVSGSHALLIDAGPDPAVLHQQLRKQSIHQIDALIVTHDHDDHLAGAPALAQSYGVKKVLCAQGAQTSPGIAGAAADLGADVQTLQRGDRVYWNGIILEVIGPLSAALDPTSNESSLIIVISSDKADTREWYQRADFWERRSIVRSATVLIGGDAETAQVAQALASRDHSKDGVGVLKLGHHGSAESVDTSLLDLTTPDAIVISVGALNPYGHPAPSTLALCERSNIRILRTDRDGPITIELEPLDVAQ